MSKFGIILWKISNFLKYFSVSGIRHFYNSIQGTFLSMQPRGTIEEYNMEYPNIERQSALEYKGFMYQAHAGRKTGTTFYEKKSTFLSIFAIFLPTILDFQQFKFANKNIIRIFRKMLILLPKFKLKRFV